MCLKMLPAKFLLEQLQVIWCSVINSITHQWWSGKCYCLLPKYLYLTCTWLKSIWCTWCLPSTLSTWTCTCTCKYEKVLVLDSSTLKSTWPQPNKNSTFILWRYCFYFDFSFFYFEAFCSLLLKAVPEQRYAFFQTGDVGFSSCLFGYF